MDFLEYLKNSIDFIKKRIQKQSELINKLKIDKNELQYNFNVILEILESMQEKIIEMAESKGVIKQ